MSRFTVILLFAAIAFLSILAFTPSASGQFDSDARLRNRMERYVPEGDPSPSIGTRRHRITNTADKSMLVPDASGIDIFEGNLVQGPTSPDVSPNIVISQVYGYGGTADADFSHDFIELFNRGTSPVNVNGWSVQYAAGGDSSWTAITGLPNVTIQPGQYFLIQQASEPGAIGDALPTPDFTGSINLAGNTGKVALVSNTSTLIGTCPTGGAIVDFLGYGSSATCWEGVRIGSAPTDQAVIRRSNGCMDNDLNRDDFAFTVPIPRNTSSSTSPCIGPTTGGKIAFISDRSGIGGADTDIWIMNADGTGQTRLTNDPSAELSPSFSADGSKIVFTRGNRIFVMNVDGSVQTELTDTANNYGPKFSPDGSKIVFFSARDGNEEIYVMNANGTGQTRLTTNGGADRWPVFSPDGTKIAFTSDRAPHSGAFNIYIMDADGTDEVALATVANRDSSAPVFSPDGTRIAFETDRFHVSGAIIRIGIMNVDGSNVTQLTQAGADDSSPSFSPDGSAIAFYSLRHGGSNYEVYTMNVDGSNQRNVTMTAGLDLEPSWGVVAGALTVTNVNSSGGSGTFGIGAEIPIEVTFGAPVTVSTVSGTPTLRLATGGAGFPVNYTSGSGTAVLKFTYIVQAGHSSADLDYISISALQLNGGTINSFSGTPANLMLPAPGGPGSLGANRAIVVDGIAPNIPAINSGPAHGSRTNQTSASFGFTSNEGTFQCRLDGGTFTTCTSPANYSSLSEGTHTFDVRAVDSVGNQSPTASRTWTVDITPPEFTTFTGPAEGSYTTEVVATFSFTSNETGATFQCQLDGGGFSPCISGKQFSALGDGQHTVQVRATDIAGNPTTVSRSWTVDTLAPDTTITSGPSGPVKTATFEFQFTSNESPNVTFQCSLNGAPFTTCTSGITYGGLLDGSHTVEVRAIDLAGNIDATPASRSWIKDTVAPTVTITSGPTHNSSVFDNSATFNFNSNETATFECQLDGGGFSSCTSPKGYSGLSESSHNFQIRATDQAGNVTTVVRVWTVDRTAPDTSLTGTLPPAFTNSTTATFNFSSNETGVTFLCSINGGLYTPCTSPANYPGLAEGLRTFGVRAIDAAGNQDGSPATHSWTIDTTAPDTTIHTGPTGTLTVGNASFTFSSNEVGTFECKLDTGAYESCSSPKNYSGLGDGSHTFNVRAIDQAGNVDPDPASQSWTVNTSIVISGNVKQAPGMTNLAGVTITLSGCANQGTTTDGSGNFSFTGTYAGTCTVTPSGLGKFYDTMSRTYANVTGSVTGADFLAYNSMEDVPTKLRIENPYVVPGQSAVVRVMLNTPVPVSSVAFSVDYDEAMFAGAPVVACGSDAGAGCGLTVVSGSVGITVVPQSGTFAAGTSEVATLTFQTQATLASNVPMDITGSPTSVLIRNAANDPLLVQLLDGHIVFQQGLEGDIAGRSTGDGLLFSNDVIVARQFAAGNATANLAFNEFQRVDSAPIATKGDGLISSGDVIQARNYAANNNPPAAAGGPFGPNPTAPPPAMLTAGAETPRAVRVVPTNAVAGYGVTVPVEMKAVGNELAVRFTLEYDATKLGSPAIILAGVAPADAVLTVNNTESGRLTILVDSGTAFSSNGGPLVNVTFDVAASAGAGETRISFANNGSVSDAMANELPANYTEAFITINGANPGGVGISGRVLTPRGGGLRNARVTISGPDGYLRAVTTSTLGYYSFDGVPTGTYRIGVSSRRYRFESRTIETSAGLSGLDFVGLE